MYSPLGISLGIDDGVRLGWSEGTSEGISDGMSLGIDDGSKLGSVEGRADTDGMKDGSELGKIDTEGMNDGSVLGSRLGNEDGSNDGSLDGTCDGATKMWSPPPQIQQASSAAFPMYGNEVWIATSQLLVPSAFSKFVQPMLKTCPFFVTTFQPGSSMQSEGRVDGSFDGTKVSLGDDEGPKWDGCIDSEGRLLGISDGIAEGSTGWNFDPPQIQHASETSLLSLTYLLSDKNKVQKPTLVILAQDQPE